MKKHIVYTLENLKNENITDEQSIWGYLKYEIRKFSKNFSKKKVPEYIHCKEELSKLYQEKNRAMIRSRCDWHGHGENRRGESFS